MTSSTDLLLGFRVFHGSLLGIFRACAHLITVNFLLDGYFDVFSSALISIFDQTDSFFLYHTFALHYKRSKNVWINPRAEGKNERTRHSNSVSSGDTSLEIDSMDSWQYAEYFDTKFIVLRNRFHQCEILCTCVIRRGGSKRPEATYR